MVGTLGVSQTDILAVASAWLRIIAGVLISVLFVFVGLWMMKQRKFKYPVIIIRDYGMGKVMIEQTRAGFFASKTRFFGLIEMGGELELVTRKTVWRPQQMIVNYSDKDMHDIGGSKGFIVVQKPDDKKVLVPISQTKIENMEMVMKIAPADWRDVAVALKKKSEREMLSGLENILPYISIGIVAIACFLMFVVTFQFVAGTLGDLASKCGSVVPVVNTVLPSGAP